MFKLIRSTVGCLAQPLCSSRAIAEHMAQVWVQTVPGYLHLGRPHSLSGQSVPVHSHLHSKEINPCIQVELLLLLLLILLSHCCFL